MLDEIDEETENYCLSIKSMNFALIGSAGGNVWWGSHNVYGSILLTAIPAPMSGKIVGFANWPLIFIAILIVIVVVVVYASLYIYQSFRKVVLGRISRRLFKVSEYSINVALK